MIVFPNAKINLGLSVLSKRADGFHEVETVMYPVPLHDVLEFLPSKKFTFSVYGMSIPGKAGDNLLIKALNLLRQHHQIPPVDIKLLKTIPPGSGLGGGSSDAVFFLKALNEYFRLSLNTAGLQKYAGLLGSDCSFFLHDTPVVATGRGEKLQQISLSLKGKFFVVVYPGIHINTEEAYSYILPRKPEITPGEIVRQPLELWKNTLQNDFELFAFKKYPLLQKIKTAFYNEGALYASMTGSGSAIYAIFDRPINLRSLFPEFLIWSGFLD